MKEIPVLFENDFCMVLNKPSGLSVQGGEGVKTSLDSILSEKYAPRPLLVHRLDRDTSGLILVAKTKEAAAGFSALFAGQVLTGFSKSNGGKADRNRLIVKQYLGVCTGREGSSLPNLGIEAPEDSEVPGFGRGVIRISLDVRGKGHTKVSKESETFYRILSSGTAGGILCSLLELELGTGRMHQIRRHLAHSGFPLLGDDKYGDFSLNRELRKTAGLKHLLLHASRLLIPPTPGLVPDGLDITAAPPDYFSRFLELLTPTPHFP